MNEYLRFGEAPLKEEGAIDDGDEWVAKRLPSDALCGIYDHDFVAGGVTIQNDSDTGNAIVLRPCENLNIETPRLFVQGLANRFRSVMNANGNDLAALKGLIYRALGEITGDVKPPKDTRSYIN